MFVLISICKRTKITKAPCRRRNCEAVLRTDRNFTNRHHVEPRVKLHSPREESFPTPLIHWRNQNYPYEFGCQAREAHWWLLESRLVWSLDRFHTIYSTRQKSSRRIYVVRGEIDEKTAYIQARSSMARALENNGKARQAEGEAKVVWRKAPSWKRTKITRDLLNSLTFRTRNSQKPSRTRVRSWKHQWLLLCHVKIMNNCRSGASNKIKTKLACILEADESKRMRMGNSIPHHHEDHIARKGENSLQHYNLVHKFSPMPQAMKIPAAKAAVDKEWEKLEKISAWNLTKVRSKKQVINEARTSGAKVHFASLMDYVIWKVLNWRQSTQNTKDELCSEVTVKDDSGSYAVFTEQGSSASHMTAAKIMDVISRLPGSDGQAADAVLAYTQVKWKILTNHWKFQNRSVQTFGFVYHDTNGQNHGPVWKTESFLLSEICTVIL